jgi:prespore-specific regulator
MSTTRQDAWTRDEDLLLAEVVLRHIREGGTQLQAFEEVGKRLSRTSAACGFRWNSSIRKQYKSGIELAKKQRKEGKKSPIAEMNSVLDETETTNRSVEKTKQTAFPVQPFSKELSFEELLAYLNKIYVQARDSSEYQEIISKYESEIHKLERKIKELDVENARLEKEMKAMENDYKALIEIMERARKMVVLKEEEFAQKVKFQMDKNGNLEKLDR